jgi:hypothetical protein
MDCSTEHVISPPLWDEIDKFVACGKLTQLFQRDYARLFISAADAEHVVALVHIARDKPRRATHTQLELVVLWDGGEIGDASCGGPKKNNTDREISPA